MRRVISLVLVAVAVGATALAQDAKPPEIDFGRYHALVIGNNDYRHLPKLKTAISDATATAELLREKYGFDVKLLVDATRLDILRALNDYRRDLTERDNLLIYYAGHGVLDRETETGFWLPVDAEKDRDEFWIANADVTRRLKAVSAKHVLVVADSCYSGTLLREAPAALPSGAERSAWLERMNSLASRTALVSGGLEPVADSGAGGHSVFANAFLAALGDNTGVLDAQALFTKVSRPVILNADQTPRYSDIRQAGHEGGEFLFVPLNLSVAVTVKPAPTGQVDREALFWRSIQDSDRPRDFEEYLKQFPAGVFAGLARSRIEALEEQQTALVVPPKSQIEIDPVEAEYVAVKNANVREEPTARSARVATLKRGSSVHVAGKVKDQNWYLVERADKPLGYVYGELLKDAETVRQEEEARRKEAQRKRAVEAKRQEEERKRAAEAKRREEERKRAAEAKRREEERKRAEEAKIALAPPPKPQVPRTTQPAVGVFPSPRPPGETFRDCQKCPKMVVIPAGSFVMGSPASEVGRQDDEGPQHRVTIPRAFALGKYEVTFSEWKACLQAGGCNHRPNHQGWGRSRRPAINVSWDNAKAYAVWLSQKTGQEYRLPSEAEWEYAARGGTTTAYHFGDSISSKHANYGWNKDKTVRVGNYPANAFGLHDVHGNVWEWVEDCWNHSYRGAPSDGSAWTTGICTSRVARGGSWDINPSFLRAASRDRFNTGFRLLYLGFRIARTLP